MKISLPENISEIKLGQYQRYLNLVKQDLDAYTFINRKIEIFTGLKRDLVEQISRKEIEEISVQIDKALNEDAKFVNRFFIGNVEFGFINLDKMSQAEYIDVCEYSKDIEQGTNLHKLLAVLFRPIIDKGLAQTYKVASYKGTKEYADIMKQAPMNVVNGCLGFFLTLQNDLLNHILKSTEAERVKEAKQQDTLKNGVGLHQ